MLNKFIPPPHTARSHHGSLSKLMNRGGRGTPVTPIGGGSARLQGGYGRGGGERNVSDSHTVWPLPWLRPAPAVVS